MQTASVTSALALLFSIFDTSKVRRGLIFFPLALMRWPAVNVINFSSSFMFLLISLSTLFRELLSKFDNDFTGVFSY